MIVEGLKDHRVHVSSQEVVRDILGRLTELNRNIVSDEFEESLNYLRRYIDLVIHRYKTGTACWTWEVPPKWKVKNGYIKHKGQKIISIEDHPLHIMSYSTAVNKTMKGAELLDHVYVHRENPQAIPYEFSFYVPRWGFCMTHAQRDAIKKEETYEVLIDSEFISDYLHVGEYTVKGKSDEHIIFVSHLDHPCQANDGLVGCAVNVALALLLGQKPKDFYYNYTFLFLPETIGSIAYLSQNEHLIPKIRYAVFNEATGLNNPLVLQESYEKKGLINQYALYAMKRIQGQCQSYPYLSVLANDEKVFNAPGIDIPSISITRVNQEARILKEKQQKSQQHLLIWPYPQYHSHLDNLDGINYQKVLESVEYLDHLVRIIEEDFIPQRKFRGPIFLSKYGLWIDWRKDYALSENLSQLVHCLEGDRTVFQIAEKLGLDFEKVCGILNKFYDKGLIEKRGVPIGFDRFR